MRERFGSLAVTLAVVLAIGVPLARAGSEATAAVEAFVQRIADVDIRDLAIEQDVVLYHTDGLHVRARGTERLLVRPPGRQRQEQVIDGQREVRLVIGGRTWMRDASGRVSEVPSNRDQRGIGFLVPVQRSASDLLAEWKALGIRDDVTHVERVARRTVTVIGARAGDHESPALWLDPDRGVVRFVARESLPGGPSVVDVSLSEHRPLVGAFSFPWRQEVFVDGKLILLVVVRSVRANVGLPDRLFDPDALGRDG